MKNVWNSGIYIRHFYTQMLYIRFTHTDALRHRRFYTQTPLRTDAFTNRLLYTQTLSHTACSEQSLRILMWNASYVQKPLQLHLTGMGRWRDPKSIEKLPSPEPELDAISWKLFHFNRTKSLPPWQIAKTVQALKWYHLEVQRFEFDLKEPLKKRHAGSWLSRLPLTRNEKWCRYADWRPNLYHQIKWVSSLVAVPMICRYPLLHTWKWENTHVRHVKSQQGKKTRKSNHQRKKKASSGRSFTSIRMLHTHKLDRRVRKLRSGHMGCKWRWGKWKRDENETEVKVT